MIGIGTLNQVYYRVNAISIFCYNAGVGVRTSSHAVRSTGACSHYWMNLLGLGAKWIINLYTYFSTTMECPTLGKFYTK